jgi:hypothetical protein
MSTRILKCVAFVVIFSFIAGCTLPRKPRVENGKYKNFEHEFLVKIPSGWDYHATMPEQVKDGVAGNFAENVVCMLSNPETQGYIILEANRSDFDIVSMGHDKSAAGEQLTAFLEERGQQLADGGIENYTYEIGSLDVAKGYGPTLIFTESAQSSTGDHIETAAYLNQCQKAKTCMLIVTLISKEDTYAVNYEAFALVANSAAKVYM